MIVLNGVDDSSSVTSTFVKTTRIDPTSEGPFANRQFGIRAEIVNQVRGVRDMKSAFSGNAELGRTVAARLRLPDLPHAYRIVITIPNSHFRTAFY